MDINICKHSFIRKDIKYAKGNPGIGRLDSCEDSYAVAILPDDWVPRRSGPILANYLKQREKDHITTHEEMVRRTVVANREINAKLQVLAECLLARINQSQIEMDCVVNKYQDTADGVLSKEAHGNALKTINELSLRRTEDKANFTRDATVLEKERADKLKNILRDTFQRLVSVGHMTPKALLHDFDQHIYEINHQLLSNSRAYTELEANLLRGLDESVVQAKSSLNQLTLGVVVIYRGRREHSYIRQSIEENLSLRRPSSARMRETSIVNILGDVSELELCVGRLVEAYRTAVLSIISGFYNKMANLERDLFIEKDFTTHALQDEFIDIRNLVERPMRKLSISCREEWYKQKTFAMSPVDSISMQKSLWSLGVCLRDTYSLLYNAGHLWDAHILRSALAQTLTIAAVEDLLTHHDTIQLASEVPISIAIEQLRCSPDAKSSEQQYEVIVQMLARTADIYLQHSEAELGRLDEFMNLPNTMTKTLLSEFDLFLEKYPRTKRESQEVTLPKGRERALSRVPSSLRQPLPRAILQTELQEMSLLNWRNGFLESFEGNIALIPEELKHQAQLWVEERSTSLHMRYSVKMISHNVRVDRVKALLNVRLAELRHHEDRLESHLAAISYLVARLPVEASEFAGIEEPFLYPIVDWVKQIRIGLEKLQAHEPQNRDKTTLTMESYAIRLPKYRYYYENSLDKAIADYKRFLEHRIQEARISNVRFLSHIKLFSEGGNYAAQEAMKACGTLMKASDALESCVIKSLEALKNRRTQLLAYIDANYIVPLMRVIDLNKPPVKSVSKLDKKKKK